MDQLDLNIKSLGICSDKRDLLMISGLGKLEKNCARKICLLSSIESRQF